MFFMIQFYLTNNEDTSLTLWYVLLDLCLYSLSMVQNEDIRYKWSIMNKSNLCSYSNAGLNTDVSLVLFFIMF